MNQKVQDRGHPAIPFGLDFKEVFMVPTGRVKHFLHQCSVLSRLLGTREFGQDVCSVVFSSGYVDNVSLIEMEGQISGYVIVSLEQGLTGLVLVIHLSHHKPGISLAHEIPYAQVSC